MTSENLQKGKNNCQCKEPGNTTPHILWPQVAHCLGQGGTIMLGNHGKKRRGQKKRNRDLQGFRSDLEPGKWKREVGKSSRRHHLCIGCG